MCKRVFGPSNLFAYAIPCLEVWYVYPKVARTMSSVALVKKIPGIFAVVRLHQCAVISFQNYQLSCLKVKYDVKVKGKTADQNSSWDTIHLSDILNSVFLGFFEKGRHNMFFTIILSQVDCRITQRQSYISNN